MRKHMKIKAFIVAILLMVTLIGCSTVESNGAETVSESTVSAISDSGGNENLSNIVSVEGSILDTENMFSDRELEQSVDLSEAKFIELQSGQDITIEKEGVYVLSGNVENVTITIDADDEAKIQIVLDGVNIINEDFAVIYVLDADKVFITTTDSNNYMEVSNDYIADGDTNVDAVIFSKSDLAFNGVGNLEILSNEGNGITSKDDLKITGGSYVISSAADSLEANDSIRIYDGDITIVTEKDGLHCENENDETLGYVYIQGGLLHISAADDAILGNSIVQIDGGTINIDICSEGIEGTYIQINGGDISIISIDDGINATSKSTYYDMVIEVNGGNIVISMGNGDTDGFDSNGDIYINGGTIDVTAASSFDADGEAVLNGGVVTVNGEIITEIVQMQMGGQKRGK